jgi:hypothetical protein
VDTERERAVKVMKSLYYKYIRIHHTNALCLHQYSSPSCIQSPRSIPIATYIALAVVDKIDLEELYRIAGNFRGV